MSGLDRKQKRTEARREYDRFKRMWREDMRLAGLHGKKVPYRRPTFSQWFQQYERESSRPAPQAEAPQYPNAFGVDPWAEQLDERVTSPDGEGERGVATIQIVGDEEA